jgi:transglutaminase-like putative cysteine protease
MPSFPSGRPVAAAIQDLSRRINRDFVFKAGATAVGTPITQVLAGRTGVCQDFAHLAIAALRSMGLAARYVSGYLETDPPPGQPRLVGADVSHAWVSAFVPGSGWIDVDPTNDQLVGDRYVTTGWGRDYGDVAPLKGVIFTDGDTTALDVAVDVRRIPTPAADQGRWHQQAAQQQQVSEP